MSVPSWNTTVTTERPYFDTDRTCAIFGKPDIARSTGMLMYCSTSTGDSAGAAVIDRRVRLLGHLMVVDRGRGGLSGVGSAMSAMGCLGVRRVVVLVERHVAGDDAVDSYVPTGRAVHRHEQVELHVGYILGQFDGGVRTHAIGYCRYVDECFVFRCSKYAQESKPGTSGRVR